MESKATILGRIQAAAVPAFQANRTPIIFSEANLSHFIEAVEDYKAIVHQVTQKNALALIIKIAERKNIVVPKGFPAEWRPEGAVEDDHFSHRELDAFDAALTLCAIGVEETGTIVLDAGEGQGRRALTLIPDHHICIIRQDQVVASVNEAVQKLSESVEQGRPLTWISGPSATSDIELVRVEGVHGPRKLEVIVLRT